MSERLHPRNRRLRLACNARIVAGALILACVSSTAAFAPQLALYDPLEQHLLERRQSPSLQHPMGLDELGRDNLSRVIFGARLSLQVGVTSVLLAVATGVPIGAVAGYQGGWSDSLIMGVMDMMQAFPTLLLAIAVVVVLGYGSTNTLYAVAFTQVPIYTRLMRVGVMAIKQREHVLAARAIGASPSHQIWHHILPGCLVPLSTQAMLGIGTAILEVGGLSFLGLGVQPPIPEWGAMLGQGRGAMFAAPHIVLFPGLAIMLTVLGFNLLGDGLRDASDPRL
jgi:peptide/nickel transport system permease protein